MDNNTAHSTTSPSTMSASYVDAYTPPAATQTDTVPNTPVQVPSMPLKDDPVSSKSQSEELEDQNIFTMLGVVDGTPEQREKFLDELQQVIWEDFLEYDVKLLTTKEEQLEVQKMLADTTTNELEKQEKIVIYLEKLIPDLEEIMLEKALELKEEMVRERVKGLKEFNVGKAEQLAKIQSAEQLMTEGKWRSAVTLLNSL